MNVRSRSESARTAFQFLLGSLKIHEKSYVTLIPAYVNLDRENNMVTSYQQYNARNPNTYKMQVNGVHPAVYGYYQIADTFFGWLKAH